MSRNVIGIHISFMSSPGLRPSLFPFQTLTFPLKNYMIMRKSYGKKMVSP